MVQGGASRLPECGVKGFQKMGKAVIQSEVIIFSPGRGLFLSRKVISVVWKHVLSLGTQKPFPYTSLKSLPVQILLMQLQTVLSSLHLNPKWVAVNVKPMCWPPKK